MNTASKVQMGFVLALFVAACGNDAPDVKSKAPAKNPPATATQTSTQTETSQATSPPSGLPASLPTSLPAGLPIGPDNPAPAPAPQPAISPPPAQASKDAGAADGLGFDPFALAPDLSGLPGADCLACVKKDCNSSATTCAADSECMKSFNCAVKTCDLANSLKGGSPDGVKDCMMSCFQGSTSNVQQQGQDMYNCVTGSCGSSCESLVNNVKR